MIRGPTIHIRHVYSGDLAPRNLASERVAIKCGFSKEGMARGANFVRGKHVDMTGYALLRDEPHIRSGAL